MKATQQLCPALLFALIISVSFAGCLHTPETNLTISDSDTTASPVADSTPHIPNATGRAPAAEKQYIVERLQNASCLDSWGAWGGTYSKSATITGGTADGVYVNVSHPYWYGFEEDSVDGGTDARYFVTNERVRRVHGDTVSAPC